MPKEENITIEGVVEDSLPNAQFKVKLENGHVVLAHLCGKMRQNFIKVVVGDAVQMELSPYDLFKGRIMIRHK